MSFKVIADHIRSLSFCYWGWCFREEGRGYVLRRLLAELLCMVKNWESMSLSFTNSFQQLGKL